MKYISSDNNLLTAFNHPNNTLCSPDCCLILGIQKTPNDHTELMSGYFFKGCLCSFSWEHLVSIKRKSQSPQTTVWGCAAEINRKLFAQFWCLLHICNYVQTSWALHCANSFFHALLCTKFANFAPAQFINAAHHQSLLMAADNWTKWIMLLVQFCCERPFTSIQ